MLGNHAQLLVHFDKTRAVPCIHMLVSHRRKLTCCLNVSPLSLSFCISLLIVGLYQVL